MMRGWDEAEFERIFRAHYDRLFRVVKRVLRSDAEADEVCSESLWRLYRSGPAVVAAGSAAGWLYRTGTRAALDMMRAGRRRRDREEQGERMLEPALLLMDEHGDALQAMLRAEQVAEVRRALAKMDEAKAQMLLLRYVGLSYAQIALTLRMNANSVGSTLARAEAEFCKLYHKQEEHFKKAALRTSTVKEGR